MAGFFGQLSAKQWRIFFNFRFDEETGLWATIYLSYESWSGGTNGMKIGTVWYNETGWTFEQEQSLTC